MRRAARQRLVLRAAPLLLAAATAAHAGEAPDARDLVRQAGFRAILASSPEEIARLEAMTPPLLVVPTRQDGETLYTLADPYACKCVYVGREPEYVRFRHLSAEARLEQELPRPMAPTAFELEHWDAGLRW